MSETVEGFKLMLLMQKRALKEAEEKLKEQQALVDDWNETVERTKEKIRELENVK